MRARDIGYVRRGDAYATSDRRWRRASSLVRALASRGHWTLAVRFFRLNNQQFAATDVRH